MKCRWLNKVRAAIAAGSLCCAFVLGCDSESPTEPLQCRNQTAVLANDPDYIARTETLREFPGRLVKNCQSNARYCYYLGAVPVYTLGNDTILDGFVDDNVLIVGKAVSPTTGSGELWPGTICRFNF